MSKIGCPLRFKAMVCDAAISDGMQALVQTDGGYSETLLVTEGVKQDCVMAPTPFRMMFSDMLTNTFRTVMLVSQSSTVLVARQSA